MNNDLISRETLKKALNYTYDCAYIASKSKEGIVSDIIETIDNAPTVEIPHGEWVVKEGTVACYTACNKCDYADYNHKRPNFCPNCGADMRGE